MYGFCQWPILLPWIVHEISPPKHLSPLHFFFIKVLTSWYQSLWISYWHRKDINERLRAPSHQALRIFRNFDHLTVRVKIKVPNTNRYSQCLVLTGPYCSLTSDFCPPSHKLPHRCISGHVLCIWWCGILITSLRGNDPSCPLYKYLQFQYATY